MTNRIEFSPAVKRSLSERAGQHCSLPLCNKPTTGPDQTPTLTMRIGMAAHIHSASPGGPRGQDDLSDTELGSEDNGIWVCRDHGTTIDANRGVSYPPETLRAYKELHFARIIQEQQGVAVKVGWFHKIELIANPFFRTPSEILLGKVTSIVGGNDSGKSLLCELVNGFSNEKELWRYKAFDSHTVSRLTYFTPDKYDTTFSNRNSQQFLYKRDDRPSPSPPIDFKIIAPLRLEDARHLWHSDLKTFAHLLGVSESEVLSITNLIEEYGTGDISNLCFEDDGDTLRLTLSSTAPDLVFSVLSGSEQVRVLLEYAILAASYYSNQLPTMLILDCGIWQIDSRWLRYQLDILLREKYKFQTLIASLPRQSIETGELFNGTNIVSLIGKKHDVIIEQSQ